MVFKAFLTFIIIFFYQNTAMGLDKKQVPNPFPKTAKSYTLYINEKLTWGKDIDTKLPPASLTKILTAVIALENSKIDDIVTVTASAENETGTKLNLKKGEKYYLIDLVSASLMQSANDACHTIATHLAGSEKNFVKMMNEKAKQLSLKNTNFTNACGHDDTQHYSTARDISKLTFYALKNILFSKIVSLQDAMIESIDGKRKFVLDNKNALIGRYKGAIGVKTGYTLKAGKCLVALAEKDGTKVLLTLLNAPDRWWSAVDMLDQAFFFAKAEKLFK